MSANNTGRKEYSKVLKFRCTEESIISAMDAGSDQTLENVSIKNFVRGFHEDTLNEIYRNTVPSFIAKVENIEPDDYFESRIDKLITSMHNYLSKIIEKTLIVYYHHKAVMAVNIKIDKKSDDCTIKILGDSPNEKIILYSIPKIIRKTYGDRKLRSISFFLFEYQKILLRYLESLDFQLPDKYAMVCNYEKFL